MTPEEEKNKNLRHFQLALSMVGISASLMTCEMIASLAARVNERGAEFTLGEAEAIKTAVQARYQAKVVGTDIKPAVTPLKEEAKEGKEINLAEKQEVK